MEDLVLEESSTLDIEREGVSAPWLEIFKSRNSLPPTPGAGTRVSTDAAHVEVLSDIAAVFQIVLRDAAGRETFRLNQVEKSMRGSRSDGDLQIELCCGPFRLELRPLAASSSLTSSVRSHFEFSSWVGQRLSQLDRFDDMLKLSEAVASSDILAVECRRNGERLFQAKADLGPLQSFFGEVTRAVAWLAEARRVAQDLRVDPRLPENIGDKDYFIVAELRELVKRGEFRSDGAGQKLSGEVPAESISRIIPRSTVDDFCLRANPHTVSFMGETIFVRDFSITLTRAQLEMERSKPEQHARAKTAGTLVEIVGTEGSELIIRGNPVPAQVPATERKPIWEITAELGASIPDEQWAKIPTDLSINLDHYLYGAPKVKE